MTEGGTVRGDQRRGVVREVVRKGHISKLHLWWARRPLDDRLRRIRVLRNEMNTSKLFHMTITFVALLTSCAPVMMGTTPTDSPAHTTAATGSTPTTPTTLSSGGPKLTLVGLYPVSLIGPKDTNRYPSEVVIETSMRGGGMEKILFHPKLEQGPDGVFHLKRGFLYAVVANVYMESGGRLIKIRRTVSGTFGMEDSPLENVVLPPKKTGWVYAMYKWSKPFAEPVRLVIDVVGSDGTSDGAVSNQVSVGPVVVDE